MIRKLLLLLLFFLLMGCKPVEEKNEDIIEYIDPAKDIFIFSALDSGTQYRIRKANGNKDYSNYQFKMLFQDVYEGQLHDINGDLIDLKGSEKLIIEVVSVECSHCRKQNESINDFLEHFDGTFIQYFNIGDNEEIREFYGDSEIPEELIVISRDEDFKEYLLHELGLKKYPSLLAYYEGKLSFMVDGETDIIGFREFCDLSFEKRLSRDDLIDKDGNDLLTINRTIDDVKNDLSIENQNRIKALDNDGYTAELTYSLMSQKVDFTRISNKKSDIYINEIDDFTIYQDDELVLLYTYLKDDSQIDRVEFINTLMEDNPDLSFIVVLVEGMDSSSNALRNMKVRFNCPVVSTLGYIPEDFFRFSIAGYPSAVFVNRGTFTGAYSNIKDKESFKKATEIFLGEGCVAYKTNNQTNG